MQFTEEELKKIKDELPRGALQKLADKFDMQAGSVRKILSGSRNNDEVVLAAVSLAKEHQAKLQQAKAALAS